jgi:hypothetical protein
VVAGTLIADKAKELNLPAVVSSPFFTPLVLATWTPIMSKLTQARVASKTADGVSMIDVAGLRKLMDAKKRWSDLPGDAFASQKSILVSTTDPAKSNSAASYLGLLAAVASGGEAPDSEARATAVAEQLAHVFSRQGYKESYVNGAFEDYVAIGIGKSALAFVYEAQMISYAAKNKGLQQDMVMAYPNPGIFSKMVCVSVKAETKRFCDLLSTDPTLQKVAVRFGFRSTMQEEFMASAKSAGLIVPARIENLVDMPSHNVMMAMLAVIQKEGK